MHYLYVCLDCYLLYTVKPLILAALNFDGYSYEIILAPLILAFLLAELLVG